MQALMQVSHVPYVSVAEPWIAGTTTTSLALRRLLWTKLPWVRRYVTYYNTYHHMRLLVVQHRRLRCLSRQHLLLWILRYFADYNTNLHLRLLVAQAQEAKCRRSSEHRLLHSRRELQHENAKFLRRSRQPCLHEGDAAARETATDREATLLTTDRHCRGKGNVVISTGTVRRTHCSNHRPEHGGR